MFQQLRVKLANKLQRILQKHIENRPPDFTVGKDYLRRWWIIPRNPWFNIYYHQFRISDDDRAMHDHMYFNLSFLLEGDYIEHTVKGKFPRSTGDLKVRVPTTLHRIEIPKGKVCWTLFVTGPRLRDWGFQVGPIVKNWLGIKTKSGWMDHETYIAKYGEQLNN
jgi:hypothetical protein